MLSRAGAAVQKRLYTIVFLFIVAAGYLPVWKDGLSIIWNLDGIGQYFPSFLYIGQYLRDFLTGLLHGALVLPVWDLSIAMGEDIVGALNYYGFGDPINLLAIFATRANGVYVYMFCFFLRLWLAGQTFRLYCREVGMEYRASLAAALSYAFCGFAVYGGGRYIEWLSVLIYFPLLLIGAERIMKDRQKPWILTLTVAYAALCGFYFLYMSCLCLGVYCAVRLVSIYGWKPFRRLLRKCLTLLRHFIPGLLLAAPVFLPAVSAYLNSERLTQGGSVTDILFSLSSYIPSLNRSLLYAVFDLFHDQRQLLSGILLVELLALVLLFTIRSRKALQLKIAVLTALIALHLPISGWVFNAFGETNERWCFWVHFVFALSFAYVLTVFPSTEIRTSRSDIRFIGRKPITLAVCVLLLGNILFNLWFLYDDTLVIMWNWNSEMIACDEVEKYIDSPVNASTVVAGDSTLFRVSNDMLTDANEQPENVAMLNDYYGTTWWFSIINSDVQSYANMSAQETLKWRSWGFDNNLMYEAFAGVKYYFCSNPENVKEEYKWVEQVTFNGESWDVYENPYYFGMAYIRDADTASAIFDEAAGYEEYYEKLYDLYIDGQEQVEVTYSESKNMFTCTVDTGDGDEVVLSIPYHRNWKAYVDGEEVEVCRTDMMCISISPGGGGAYHSAPI